MAIQISGTTVVNDSRQLQNIASLDATTEATISAVAGVPTTTNAVGTYVVAWHELSGYSYGDTISAANIKFQTSDGGFYSSDNNGYYNTSSGLSGTWRFMKRPSNATNSGRYAQSLFVRIS